MIAIMVTMILMLVISLVVLGFAQVSRHEQRNSLDNQLSTQAYYAAESGVNDAALAVHNKIATGAVPIPAKKTCGTTADYDFSTSSQLSSGVSYSCVLIDPAPQSLAYTVGSDGVVIPLISGSGNQFSSITISWTPVTAPDGSVPSGSLADCPATAGNLLPASGAGSWNCTYPMLRAEMVPTSTLSRASFQANTKVNFLEPVQTGGGGVSVTQGGLVVGAKCTAATATCQVKYTGFSGSRYYMHLAALYGTTNVTITATDGGGAVGLEGAQALFDVTGKAQDVLRRILVAIDLTDANAAAQPSGALVVGDSICKRFSVTPNYFSGDGVPGGNGNPLCEAVTVGTPDALADFDTGCGDDCTPGDGDTSGTGGPFFSRSFVNKSSTNGVAITRCTWEWGDGTAPGTTACNVGESIVHKFPVTPPGVCTTYTVTLTIYLANGTSQRHSLQVVEPHGKNAGC
jgi:hypothetical protein